MPCPKCNSLLVRIKESDICPNCSGIVLLDRKATINELGANFKEVESALSSLLKNRVEKNRILKELAWQREKFSRDFFSKYQGFDLSGFLSLNLLIFRTMKEPYFNAKKDINYSIEAKELVDAFKTFIQTKSQYLLFEQGLFEAIRADDKIHVIPNEHYFSILNTYEDNDIWAQSKTEERIKEYKPIFDSIIRNQPLGSVSYTPEEFVDHFYIVISQLYCSLLRNEIYDEVFGLIKKCVEIALTPSKLMDFVNSYRMNENSLAHTSVSEFISRAKKHFGTEEKKTRELLMFYENSTGNFPMFILINGRVYISHRTAFLVYILMHAVIYKDMFNKETEKRSREFEREEVRKSFENIGWTYSPNRTDKKNQTLEIDGIATFDRQMLVIECKGWKLYPFYEYKNRQNYFVRDIKGIADGEKFTDEKSTKIPSLTEKIDFVKNHMDVWGLSPSDFDVVSGAIIMRSYPPMSEYKGIKILCIKEIPRVFDLRKGLS